MHADRDDVIEMIREAIGRDMLSLRQCIRARVIWPNEYTEFLEDMEYRLRANGYDEDFFGVDDLSDAVVELVEEAAQ